MTEPRVSCVIPVFNGERYLGETLDSVFAQTHPMFEVIVADDGSTDGTKSLVAARPEPIVYLHQENAGHAAARNLGWSHARGEFVAFVDADDLWDRRKTELQLARFAARPELGLCFAHLQNFWSPDLEKPLDDDPNVLVPIPGYTSVTMLARRDLFERVGPLDTTLRHGNDRDWFFRASEAGVAHEMLPEVLVQRRLHLTNRSRDLAASSRAEYLRIVKASLDRRRQAGKTMQEYGFGVKSEE